MRRAGEVLIRVEWTAINFKDAMVTRPGNRVARKFPLVPGVEGIAGPDEARASICARRRTKSPA